jgi:hypothetical protein
MSDLHTLMHEAAGPVPATTAPALAEADVARGRRAWRRQRVARVGASSGLVLAAAAVGAFAIVSPNPAPTTTPAGPSSSAVASPSAPALNSANLVAYTGEQPVGYTLDRVPEGWEVSWSTRDGLTLAPQGEDAGTDPAAPGFVSLVNRIAVGQEGAVPTGVTKDEVEVDGRPAVIAHMLGADGTADGTLTLFLQQPSGAYLSIQVWRGIGWGNDQIAQFAAGVHITKDATVGVG